MDIEKLIAAYPAMTDIHITEGAPIMVRISGILRKLKENADAALFDELSARCLTGTGKEAYEKKGSFDGAFFAGMNRLRIHMYHAGSLRAAALRILPDLSSLPPDSDQPWLEKIAALDHGLVLVSGPSGSGKTTTLARILSLINAKRACHIITLEDPVEYFIPSQKALIHQREVGSDVPSFAAGIRDALREDPDVITVGEMRDSDTISSALMAAETGHLVLGTLHTTRAADSVGRIIHSFPEGKQAEVRALLSTNLKYVSAQQLYRTGKETFLLREILANIPAVSHLIREGKEEQIPSYMEMGLQHMRTLKQAAYGLRNISERERDRLMKTLEI